jgi:hypothetical protein
MTKVIYINKEAVLSKKEELVNKRNEYLINQNYPEADKVLIRIQALNEIIMNML